MFAIMWFSCIAEVAADTAEELQRIAQVPAARVITRRAQPRALLLTAGGGRLRCSWRCNCCWAARMTRRVRHDA